ncbi:MAG TPA: hypothetical protein VJQ46_06095 [Gemmatimonadales bacterium]|nr:hypothetical protein [Gemmatimonadales bacterium]
MRVRVARRVHALLLALVFVGGSLGLPALDALLFHGASAPTPAPHYDSAGGCGDHAERCTLATAFAATQLPSLRATPSCVSEAPVLRCLTPGPDRPSPARTERLPLSRAPPLLQPIG